MVALTHEFWRRDFELVNEKDLSNLILLWRGQMPVVSHMPATPKNSNELHLTRDEHGQRHRASLMTRKVFAQTFKVAQADDPDPSADFLRWWFLAGKRYLAVDDAFHQLPPDEILIEATQR
ncbi:hypothetical protein PIB30_012957 [Stylosanthes scabra]|uniref:Uncharacterized protein n=1 Tax=Stylosanthes scabra TaxID=79078 RepID=A0ABU6Z4P6_9FABA|nr:hypothetical protein [Stylosanthes scabra]